MNKFNPVFKKFVKLPDVKKCVIKISEKTIEITQMATLIFAELKVFFLFLLHTIKGTFSRSFEFKEFLLQCYQIGNRTLPLISVIVLVFKLVLNIK